MPVSHPTQPSWAAGVRDRLDVAARLPDDDLFAMRFENQDGADAVRQPAQASKPELVAS